MPHRNPLTDVAFPGHGLLRCPIRHRRAGGPAPSEFSTVFTIVITFSTVQQTMFWITRFFGAADFWTTPYRKQFDDFERLEVYVIGNEYDTLPVPRSKRIIICI
jgi:hypothetical protein